jgi:hypothetical protein
MVNGAREYEIYLPSKGPNGALISPAEIAKIKAKLAEGFGGYMHFQQRCEGAWKVGPVTFYDEITIVRVLDDGSSNFDMAAFRKNLETELQQEEVLIVKRTVGTI